MESRDKPVHDPFSRQCMREKHPCDLGASEQRVKEGPCFLCELVAGTNPHHVISEDQSAMVFWATYASLPGYALLAPREHREQATGDFPLEASLQLQRLMSQLAEAIRQVVPTERLSILTLGRQQGNRHVPWHVAPLPPGVPSEQQPDAALASSKGVLALPDEDMAELARSIRQALERLRSSPMLSPSN